MVNIDSVPSYIFNKYRGYYFVIAMRRPNNTLLYQTVCKTYKEATKKIKVLNNHIKEGYSFEIFTLNEITH
jgi:hypothetical protein